MPTYNEIAHVLVPTGQRAARPPYDAVTEAEDTRQSPSLGCYLGVLGSASLAVARDVGDLAAIVTATPDSLSQQGPFMSLTWQFEDRGNRVDAETAFKALAAGAARFTIPGLGDAGGDIVVETTFTKLIDEAQGFGIFRFSKPGTVTGLPTEPAALAQTLHGVPVIFEAGNPLVEWLPDVPVTTPQAIWVRRGDVTADLASLAITPADTIESVAQRTVQLETEYMAILEDLDTQVEYGRDVNGLPIVWRVEGTVRGERSMIVNLAARIV